MGRQNAGAADAERLRQEAMALRRQASEDARLRMQQAEEEVAME